MPRSKAVAKKSFDKDKAKSKLHVQKIERKAAPSTTGVKRRFKPGRAALREIKRYQRSTEFLIQRAPFQRKGITVFIQSAKSWALSPMPRRKTKRTHQKFYASDQQHYWLCKKLVSLQSLVFSKTPTYALLMHIGSLWCPRMLPLPDAFEETNTDFWSFIQHLSTLFFY